MIAERLTLRLGVRQRHGLATRRELVDPAQELPLRLLAEALDAAHAARLAGCAQGASVVTPRASCTARTGTGTRTRDSSTVPGG